MASAWIMCFIAGWILILVARRQQKRIERCKRSLLKARGMIQQARKEKGLTEMSLAIACHEIATLRQLTSSPGYILIALPVTTSMKGTLRSRHDFSGMNQDLFPN